MVDPDWGELIRSELDSYVPERLPARFVPGAHRQHRAPMVDWRPVAITIAVLLLGLGFATIAGGPENIYRSVTQMTPSRNVTPTPTITATPTPEPTTRAGAATSSPNPPRKTSPPPPPASGTSSSQAPLPAPDQAAGPPPQAATPPPSSPSPSSLVCLPLIGCLD
jgi:hypothetical protein